MNKLFFAILCSFVLSTYSVMAEEAAAPVEATEAAAVETPAAESAPAAEAEGVSAETVAAEAPVPAEADLEPAEINTENLEFISGEVTAMDEVSKSLTVKLYGETENDANQKILTVKVDETTDITDGEKDRDLKSLTAGTEVDVEYDPASNKATYIFVY